MGDNVGRRARHAERAAECLGYPGHVGARVGTGPRLEQVEPQFAAAHDHDATVEERGRIGVLVLDRVDHQERDAVLVPRLRQKSMQRGRLSRARRSR